MKAHVKIVGKAPLLMNRRPMEDADTDKVKKKGETIDPKEDAEKKAYLDPNIGYYVPSGMIEASLREAGKNIKKGRGSMRKTVESSVFSEQEKIPLNRKDYDAIDKRFGTHPSTGNGILISRIRFDRWQLEFDLNFNETRVDEKTLKAIIEEAGAFNGIGSYKPKFGRFDLVEFGVEKKAKVA